MSRDFWKSAGLHLVTHNGDGWLNVTPDFLRAYYTRPEIHPVEDSCASEHALFERLMADPLAPVPAGELGAIEDRDAASNYAVILRFRDHLLHHGSIEAAYAALFTGAPIAIPPMFIDQMAHMILRNLLDGETDPFKLRAAELLFRKQTATIGEDQLMLADHEVVEMQARPGGPEIPEQLIPSLTSPRRETSLDILTEETRDEYWSRSDRFDMAVDFRFTQPAPDALAQVISAWIRHFLGVETRIQAVKSIRDERWSWHIGCDAEATAILNRLYQGDEVSEADLYRVIALYRLEFANPADALDRLKGRPVYLGLAIDRHNHLVFKPQNLLSNLPVRRA